MKINDSAKRMMTKARMELVLGQPFFGTLALRLVLQEDDSVKTASTDGVTLRYNPKAVCEMPFTKVVGMVAHTIMHPAMLHHTRRGSRGKGKWNRACDHAINPLLIAAGFDLPSGASSSAMYANLSAEQIYSMLPAEEEEEEEDDEKDDGDPNGDGGVDDSPSNGTQSEQDSEEAEWKQGVAQAVLAAKQAGKLPGFIEKLMGELLTPTIPWRDVLKRFMTEKCNDDFSWKRGNRRFVAQGLYLPSRVSEDAMGTMVVVVDTSGSIGQTELDDFGNEIVAIHREARPKELIVIYCDTKVNHVDRFFADSEPVFKLHGGGGTDFRPPFDWLDEHQITPRVFVYLTDGYGTFPSEEPSFPNMWCITNSQVVPPYGEHLMIGVK